MKKIASTSILEKDLMESYLDELFKSLPETLYTKKILSKGNEPFRLYLRIVIFLQR